MNRVFRITFLDNRNNTRTFIESGENIDDATNKLCCKLEAPDGLFCGAKGWRHVSTEEI